MPVRHLSRALAACDGGVVSRAALERAGAGPGVADRLVRLGRWQRLAPSVYLASTAPPTDEQLVTAARLHVGADVVVTGLVACRRLGLPDVPEERAVDLLTTRSRVVSTATLRVHETGRPPGTWTAGGTAHALAARAVVDGARRLPDLRSVRALVLGAVAQGHAGAQDLLEEVDRGAVRSSALVRRAVEDALAGAWSAPEAEAAHLAAAAVRAGRLPPYWLNPTVLVGGSVVGRPDGWVAGSRVGWQVDSRRHHGAPDDLERTLGVHDAYARHGLVLLHVTPRRLRSGGWAEALVDAVRAAPGPPRSLEVRPGAPLQRGEVRQPELG